MEWDERVNGSTATPDGWVLRVHQAKSGRCQWAVFPATEYQAVDAGTEDTLDLAKAAVESAWRKATGEGTWNGREFNGADGKAFGRVFKESQDYAPWVALISCPDEASARALVESQAKLCRAK
jgi:hypothetical protein